MLDNSTSTRQSLSSVHAATAAGGTSATLTKPISKFVYAVQGGVPRHIASNWTCCAKKIPNSPCFCAGPAERDLAPAASAQAQCWQQAWHLARSSGRSARAAEENSPASITSPFRAFNGHRRRRASCHFTSFAICCSSPFALEITPTLAAVAICSSASAGGWPGTRARDSRCEAGGAARVCLAAMHRCALGGGSRSCSPADCRFHAGVRQAAALPRCYTGHEFLGVAANAGCAHLSSAYSIAVAQGCFERGEEESALYRRWLEHHEEQEP